MQAKVEAVVCLFYKDHLKISYVNSLLFCAPELEILTVKHDLTNTCDIYILIVCRPPDGEIKGFIDIMDKGVGRVMATQKLNTMSLVI